MMLSEKHFADLAACSSVNPSRQPGICVATMPSLFRFLAAVAIIIAIVYGSMIALTVFVQPQPREITVTIPQDRFSRQR